MSLKDEFRESAMVENGLTPLEKYEQIADEFAIEFAEYCCQKITGGKFTLNEGELELYKKERGL